MKKPAGTSPKVVVFHCKRLAPPGPIKFDVDLFECGCFGDLMESKMSTDKLDMIRPYRLDKFHTARDACRHYFYAITIEEANWPLYGCTSIDDLE